MLTIYEKDKIKQELLYRKSVFDLFESDNDKKKSSNINKFFAHPFVITILGGILLASIGAHYQEQQKYIEIQTNWEKKYQEKQIDFLSGFSEHLMQYWVTLLNLKYNQIFLKGDKEKDFLDRTKGEVKHDLYPLIVVDLMKEARGEATLISVRALFSSKDVIGKLNKLDNLMHTMQDDLNLTEQQVDNIDREFQIVWRELVIAMREEIKV